jgi:hypothetical protein
VSDQNVSAVNRKHAQTLKDDGIVKLNQTADVSALVEIKEAFDEVVRNEEFTYSTGVGGEDYRLGIDSNSYNMVDEFSALNRIVSEDIKDILQSYYGALFKPVDARIWRNHHVPVEIESEAFSNYSHIDEIATDLVKVFIYLTDVTEDHGPFQAIPQQITKKIRQEKTSLFGSYRYPPEDIRPIISEPFKFTGKRGSIAICHTATCLHRAGVPTAGNHRDLLQITFAPSDVSMADEWLSQPESLNHGHTDFSGLDGLLKYRGKR